VHGKCPEAHYPDKKNRGNTIFYKTHLKQTTMEKFKMSLANVPGKLSRAEMKNVMAGTPKDTGTFCVANGTACSYYERGTGSVNGECVINSQDRCVCKGPNSSVVSQDCSAT
jgi:hypothetical protein